MTSVVTKSLKWAFVAAFVALVVVVAALGIAPAAFADKEIKGFGCVDIGQNIWNPSKFDVIESINRGIADSPEAALFKVRVSGQVTQGSYEFPIMSTVNTVGNLQEEVPIYGGSGAGGSSTELRRQTTNAYSGSITGAATVTVTAELINAADVVIATATCSKEFNL